MRVLAKILVIGSQTIGWGIATFLVTVFFIPFVYIPGIICYQEYGSIKWAVLCQLGFFALFPVFGLVTAAIALPIFLIGEYGWPWLKTYAFNKR